MKGRPHIQMGLDEWSTGGFGVYGRPEAATLSDREVGIEENAIEFDIL